MNRAQYLKLLEPAIRLQELKSQDYNGERSVHDYFPFGDKSYVQMLHVKSQRLVHLTAGGAPVFESVKDSVHDLINYAVFYLEYLEIEEKKKITAHEQQRAMSAQQNIMNAQSDLMNSAPLGGVLSGFFKGG